MRRFLVALAFFGITLAAQTSDKPQEDKRILGIISNIKTVEQPSESIEPMAFREKLKLGAEDSFDPRSWPGVAVSAAIGQWQNQYRSIGQGSRGFAERYAYAFADQAVGNMLGEAVFPRLLHEDPRYFRVAKGGLLRRTGYALSRVVITRKDNGRNGFNFTEFLGNGAAAAIANLYYPPEYRSASRTIVRLGLTVMTDAPFNVLKEFWPDLRHKFLHK